MKTKQQEPYIVRDVYGYALSFYRGGGCGQVSDEIADRFASKEEARAAIKAAHLTEDISAMIEVLE